MNAGEAWDCFVTRHIQVSVIVDGPLHLKDPTFQVHAVLKASDAFLSGFLCSSWAGYSPSFEQNKE